MPVTRIERQKKEPLRRGSAVEVSTAKITGTTVPRRTGQRKGIVASSTQFLAFVAEDDNEMRRLLCDALWTIGYHVKEAESGKTLIDNLQSEKTKGAEPALIVSDYRMPHNTGLDVLLAVRQWGWLNPFILITAFGDEDIINEAFRLGATVVINKPFAIDDFKRVVMGIL
jgi:two-component system, response regulator, stage 0 sporulation protein F